MGNNRVKPLKVHAARLVTDVTSIETECGTIGRTYVADVAEWRTALGNPFKIGTGSDVTCKACQRWLKVRK